MQYLNIENAKERAIERSQTGPGDAIAGAYIAELLGLSSAKDVDDLLHYRPFWVAATVLSQDPDIQDLIKVDQEAEFTQAETRIASLMALQNAYDKKYGLIVDEPFIAPERVVKIPVEGGTRSVQAEVVLW